MTKKSRRRENDPSVRREEILNAAIRLSVSMGYQKITRDMIASEAKTSCALVSRYFVTIKHLKDEVLKTAIEREILPIIAQGLSLGDSQALSINQELKKRVLAFLSS